MRVAALIRLLLPLPLLCLFCGCSLDVLLPKGRAAVSAGYEEITVPTYSASFWISPTRDEKEGAFTDRYEWKPFSVDEVRYSRTESGQDNWDVRWVVSTSGSILKSDHCLAFEWHRGTNHDGFGWEAVGGYWSTTKVGNVLPFPFEAVFEKVTRFGHDRYRVFLGSRWRDFIRADFWFGEVNGVAEVGFTGHLIRPLVDRVQSFTPALMVEYDSLEGFRIKLLGYFMKDRKEVRFKIEGGYADMRWGEGWFAGIDWRF